MPQTLLALLALVIASLLAFNVKDSSKGTYEHQVQDEFEMTAAAVALQVMETAEERPFDQRSTVAGITAANDYLPVSGGAEFSMWNTFGMPAGSSCDLDALWNTMSCDDLDDLSGITRQVVPFQMRDRWNPTLRVMEPQWLPLDVSVDVEYVTDELWQVESALPTDHKRVTVTVFLNQTVATRRDRTVPLVTMERVVSYDARKAARDFQRGTNPSRTPAGITG